MRRRRVASDPPAAAVVASDLRRPSRPAEDCLKALLVLEEGDQVVPPRRLAARLGLTGAAVTWILQRLSESGLAEYTRSRGARLTEAGRRTAQGIVRRHRILERFLVDVVGVPAHEVHEEAERLEHVASEELIAAMATLLGQPEHDPHGAPIPALAS